MWTEPVLSGSPPAEPITIEEARAQCRVLDTDHDTALNIYIKSARDYVEKRTGLRLGSQTVKLARANLVDEMPLPLAPIASLGVKYQDADDAEQTLSVATYDLQGIGTLRPVIRRKFDANWPTVYDDAEAVVVTAVCGYAVTPPTIKQAMLLLIGNWFADREIAERSPAVDGLLENYRVFQ